MRAGLIAPRARRQDLDLLDRVRWSVQTVTGFRRSQSSGVTNARSRFGELVNRARFGRERIVLTEHGKPVAAIISVEELAELQAAVDAADLAAADAVRSAGHRGLAHEQVTAALDALDAADHAETPTHAAAILAPHSAVLETVAEAERAGQVR
jgi:prevent-host-death family protein